MSKFIRIVNYIVVLLLGGSLLVSCFNDPEVEEYNYNDLILTNVAFGTIPRVMHTKSKSGADSTFMSTVSATNVYPFTIDQVNNIAYNLDSLPVGTKADKIIFSTFTVKDGSFGVKSLKTGQDTAYVVADTLDFSQGYRDFQLFGLDGTSRRTYRVEVRIHQQKEDSVTWTKYGVDDFAQRLTPTHNPAMEYDAAGLHFQLVPGEKILVSANDDADATDDAIEEADKQHLPTDHVAWADMVARVDDRIHEVYLYGTRGEGEAMAGKFWRRNIDTEGDMQFAWEYFPTVINNPNPVPALRDANLFIFDKGLLLVGVGTDNKICIKHSADRGRTWKAHTSLVLPSNLKDLTVTSLNSVVDADNNLWLLIDENEVWRGRAHKVSWNEDPRQFVK